MHKRSKFATFFVLPALTGAIAAAVALVIDPNIGQSFGNKIYSANKEIGSYSYAVARSSPSVVNIYVSRLNSNYTGMISEHGDIITSASGVIMSSDGYIVTNYHVIPSNNEPNRAIWAQTVDGHIYQAFIAGFDRRTDIAVLKINPKQSLVPISINEKYKPKTGDIVLAIGNPNNLGQTVTHGIISATARTGSGLLTREMMNIREGLQDLLQTDAPINSGNSGGALVNTNGDLVGINTASFNQTRSLGTYGISFAIPTNLVVRVMNEIIKHGRVVRGYIGISDENADRIVDNSVKGVKVGYIDPVGPAAQSNMLEGDIIIKINEKRISNVRELIDVISNNQPGTVLQVTVRRDGKTLTFPVTLAEDKNEID